MIYLLHVLNMASDYKHPALTDAFFDSFPYIFIRCRDVDFATSREKDRQFVNGVLKVNTPNSMNFVSNQHYT